MPRRLLCISYRFPPETYPLAIRVGYMLGYLKESWEIDAVTAAKEARGGEGVTIHRTGAWSLQPLYRLMRRLRLRKLLDWMIWPDPFVLWNIPALIEARRLAKRQRPDAIVVFMMPYSQGFAGLLLKKMTGVPLVLNLNDSPTCTDMNPRYPSRLHYRLARWMEDRYVRAADAVIYVSKRNMERVRDRQPEEHRGKFHLIRRGARPLPQGEAVAPSDQVFRIVYMGGMSGWNHFLEDSSGPSFARRAYQAWERLGRLDLVEMDHRSHSPVYVGQAVQQVLARNPAWEGRIRVEIYGNEFPRAVVDTVLARHGLSDIVQVHGRLPHAEAVRRIWEGDLLFQALPERLDGTPGGRISAKTYEYLTTSRPILAAVPDGENRDYLSDKPGVFLAYPRDVDEMARVIGTLAAAKFDGQALDVDRTALLAGLSHTARARAFDAVLEQVRLGVAARENLETAGV